MQIKEAWRRSTPLGRGVFLAAALAATLYGGAKPSGGNAPRRSRAVTRESLPLRSVSHRDPSYFAMPDGAETFAPWNLRGAKCDWTPANGFIAFPNGRLRPTPHDAADELGLDFGDLAAEPGVSHLWWRTELTGTRVVTWTNLRRTPRTVAVSATGAVTDGSKEPLRMKSLQRQSLRTATVRDMPDPFIGTNDFVSIELRVDENGYAIRTSDPVGGSDDETPYDPTDDDSLYLVVSAPDCVVRDGDRRPFSVTCTSDREIEGTLTLRLVSGADKVSLWTAAAGGSPVTLPATLGPDLAGGAILYAQYEETSAAVDDIVFELTLAAGNGTVSDRSSMTAVEVVRVDVASSAAGSSETPPPFLPDDPAGFDRTHASPPDRHLVIPFCNVADAAMNVSNFTVEAELVVAPSGYVPDVSWTRDATTPASGTLADADTPTPRLVNPTQGGVYRFTADFGGKSCEWTAVLPLAGGEIDGLIAQDVSAAADFADWAGPLLTAANLVGEIGTLVEATLGFAWFGTARNGYYTGRPDPASPTHKTVWKYNAVSDASGLGAVATLRGYPIRLEKLSNFLAGYACERMGVDPVKQWIAQSYGTPNDASATISWNAGAALARGGDVYPALTAMASNCWSVARASDAKVARLWPNPQGAANFSSDNARGNWNTEWHAPGFIYRTPTSPLSL